MATWTFESQAEYHIASAAAPGPPGLTPRVPARKKRSSTVDIHSSGRSGQAPPLSPVSPIQQRRHLQADELRAAKRERDRRPSVSKTQDLWYAARSLSKLGSWRAQISGPERGLTSRWLPGRVAITLNGVGGRDGGELRLYRRKIAFSHIIPAIVDGDGWAGDIDVHRVHPSVSGRSYTLFLRLANPPPPPPLSIETLTPPSRSRHLDTSQTFSDQLASPASQLSKRRSRQPSESRFTCAIQNMPGPTRGRSKTMSSLNHPVALDRAATRQAVIDASNREEAPSGESRVFIAFETAKERDDWFALFRSLAPPPNTSYRLARAHRRLKISILDLQEVAQPARTRRPSETLDEGSSQFDGSVSSGGLQPPGLSPLTPSLLLSPTNSPGRHVHNRDHDAEVKASFVKPGWASREEVRVEVLIDHYLYARTAWARGIGSGGSPFWGELFSFQDVIAFSSCTLRVLRKRGDKTPRLLGTVDLNLIPNFGKVEDERYPIRATNGSIIGEIRLNVCYQDIDVVPLVEYKKLGISHSAQTSKFLYILGGRGLLEGTMEYLARIGLCEGDLMSRVLDSCTLEARAAGSTLFRSTTPLSKTLEVLMRLMCVEYLQYSLGPTIKRVLTEFDYRRLKLMNELLSFTWHNMYDNRHRFPDFLRHILSHLFTMVKEHHDDGNDMLRYKAVSSFVFLRLIGPALMSPHLFGLADSLIAPHLQRTLTLIAKILHNLAFFSDKELLRHKDLVLFKPFIHENHDCMTDYLTSLCTPVGPREPRPPPSEKGQFLLERKSVLPEFHGEAIPFLSDAGLIDLSAEWAICTKMWYNLRKQPGFKLNVISSIVNGPLDDVSRMLAGYDDFLDRIHELAYPEPEPSITTASSDINMAERALTPCPSRPSLHLSISTAGSSDDSAHPGSRRMPNLAPRPTGAIDSRTSLAISDDAEAQPTTPPSSRPSPLQLATPSPDMDTLPHPPPIPLPRPSDALKARPARTVNPSSTSIDSGLQLLVPESSKSLNAMDVNVDAADGRTSSTRSSSGGRKRRPTLSVLLPRSSEAAPPIPPLPWSQRKM